MSMDPALQEALSDALDAQKPAQTDEFERRFKRLVENALIANHTEHEVRRVLELIELPPEKDL